MKLSLIAILSVFLALAVAQEGGFQRPKQRTTPVAPATGPVTQAEAKASFDRFRKVVQPVVRRSPGKSTLAASKEAVTRTQVVREMNSLFEALEPSFKFTPKRVAFEADRLSLKDAEQRKNLERLIRWGAVAKLGPIATAKEETLSLQEFGDALGFFMSRMAELTHMPSSKWTPALQSQ
jgi:hypothetical protein